MHTAPLPLKTRIGRIAPYFANSHMGFVMMVVGSLVGGAAESALPLMMKVLFDSGFQKGAFPLWTVPAAILTIFGVRGAAGLVAQYGLSWAVSRGTQQLRAAMFQRVMKSDPALFSQNTASSLTNTLTYEVQNGASTLVGSLMTLVRDTCTVAWLLVTLLYLNWQLTIFVFVLFPSTAFAMRSLSRRLRRLTLEGQRATDELAYVVEENVLAWKLVRLHGAQDVQASRFERVSHSLRRLALKSAMAAATMSPVSQMVGGAALSAVVVAALWQGGTPGAFVSFITAMLLLLAPSRHLADVAGPITRGLASLDRGIELINDAPVEQGGSHDPGRAQGKIELRDVTLQYGTEGAPALSHIDLQLRVGETVALVGPSGAGKSTLVNLLPRFLEPTSGQVLLDDHPLHDWNVAALRRQFALVSQDVVLFNDTVLANVAFGEPEGTVPDRAAVAAALKSANLLDHVNALANGMDTVIGHNGGQMSGGQRQRLAIARAIYKNAPILILDEATSALDSESERLVQEALERLMKGRTSLVIAHRLSTIRNADRVLVLEGGKVVEQGSHAELIAQGGLFAHLHSLQFRAHPAADGAA